MSTNEPNNKKAVLTFEGKKYIIDDLPNETKELIKSLQIADAQLKMHEDTLRLLSIGKNSLVNDLRIKLKDIE